METGFQGKFAFGNIMAKQIGYGSVRTPDNHKPEGAYALSGYLRFGGKDSA